MTIALSPKFQVVIPKKVREQLGWKAGIKLHVFAYAGGLQLVPDEPVENLRGRYPGMTMEGLREKKDREL